MVKYFWIILLSLTLVSCAIAPGMKMEMPPPCTDQQMKEFKIEPCFVAITPCLVKQMEFGINRDLYDYYVGPQDILHIAVWDHPEFNYPAGESGSSQARGSTEVVPSVSPGGYLVNAHGKIFFPLIGKTLVAGKTVDQIRADITRKLRRYVPHPQVAVRVTAFRNKKVYVIGEVNKPGMQPITDVPLTITDAINLADGLNVDNADPSHIYVIRGDICNPTVFWLNARSPEAMILAAHFELKNRDILFISTTDLARWNRAMSLILPTIQNIWFTKALIRDSHD